MSYDEQKDGRPRRSRKRQAGQERRREAEDSVPELDIHLGQRTPAQDSGPVRPATRVSRAKERQQKKSKKHKLMLIGAELLVFLGIVAFLVYSYLKSSMDLIQRLPFDENQVMNLELTEEKQEQMKGYWTIAIFGVDDRGTVIGEGTHSDVNILCNINQDTGEIKLVSVYRDTYLNISDKNSYNKINQAYFNGGPEQAVKALNKNLDLNIVDYVTFNWKAVADAINILGGVDLEISKAEYYYINAFITETVEATGIPSKHLTHAGMNHLDGVQAVAYGRLRLMDTDFARTERQRKVITLAFEKAKQADWATLNAIIQTVFPNLATNIEMSEVIDLAWDIGKLHIGETSGFPTARGDARMGSKGACVIPQTLESNVILLHQFLFGDESYDPTETVKTISAKISSDSGRYNAAKPQKDQGTGGGVIPKETEEEPTSEAEDETGESGTTAEPETDELGNPVEPTSVGITMAPEETEDGIRPGGDASGWEEWETDEHGNLVDPAWEGTGGSDASSSTEDLYPTSGTGAPGEDREDENRPGGSQAPGNGMYPTSGGDSGYSPQGPGGSTQPAQPSGPTPGGNYPSYQSPGNSFQSPGGNGGSGSYGTQSPSGNYGTQPSPGNSGGQMTPGGSPEGPSLQPGGPGW